MNHGCGGPPIYLGWYPRLYYDHKPVEYDALVADVHTDPQFGKILHQAVGNVDLLVIAIDNGKDRMVFAGPTLSHYEFEQGNMTRMSDSEWRNALTAGRVPPRPAWTTGYLVAKK